MDEFEKPRPIRTLRDHLELGMTVRAYCAAYLPRCGHSADLNMESLIQRLGWDFEMVANRQEFRRRLVCSKCGTRYPGLILSPRQPEVSGDVGGSHGRQSEMLSMEEATKLDLERTKKYREHNAAQPEPYEWKGKKIGKGRKFGRR